MHRKRNLFNGDFTLAVAASRRCDDKTRDALQLHDQKRGKSVSSPSSALKLCNSVKVHFFLALACAKYNCIRKSPLHLLCKRIFFQLGNKMMHCNTPHFIPVHMPLEFSFSIYRSCVFARCSVEKRRFFSLSFHLWLVCKVNGRYDPEASRWFFFPFFPPREPWTEMVWAN